MAYVEKPILLDETGQSIVEAIQAQTRVISSINAASTASAGNTNTPVYFENGMPITCTGVPDRDELESAITEANEYADDVIEVSVGNHNKNTSAHADIRKLISDLTTQLNVLADSDDVTLDQLSEIVAYIKANKELIEAITTAKADKEHTHNYAGSNTIGGAANSANKLNTDAGGTTQPVYFANGIPVKTTYTLGASVPSGAKFTDTTYSNMGAATSSTAGTAGLVPAPAAGKQASFLRGDGTWVVPTNTTYSVATTSANGLMSSTDKSKLDGIAANANNYTLPTASSTLGGVKTTSTVTSTSGLTACPIISGVPYYKDTNSTYTLSSFSVTATATELNVLDGITATTAELNYCDGVTSNIQTQLNGKLGTSAQAADSAKLGGTAASSYAKLASPTFTGTVTAPTLTVSTTLNIPGGKIWIA